MKWKRWFLRLATESSQQPVDRSRAIRISTPPAERLGIREVGNCEVCGQVMQARTRREEFRGRVDCDCGSRNHVDFRDVRVPDGSVQRQHVAVTSGRRFDGLTHKPDLRLDWRYGLCTRCSTAVPLKDAHVIAREDAAGTHETIAYYCNTCHTHDDDRRWRLLGHDGSHVVDSLHFQMPPGVR